MNVYYYQRIIYNKNNQRLYLSLDVQNKFINKFVLINVNAKPKVILIKIDLF